MTTKTFYRTASVDSKVAKAEVAKAWPTGELIEFEVIAATAHAARIARTQEGTLVYAATLKFAEFPPSEGESDEPEDKSDSPPSEPKEDSVDSEGEEESDSSDGPEDDDSDGEGGDPLGDSADDGPSHKPKELSPDEKMIHLLTQILQVLKGPELGPDGPGGPGDDLGLGGPAGPPPPGGPGHGGPPPPPGGGHGGPPLPPPAKPPAPGGPAFSHYDSSQKEIALIRREAGEIGTRNLIVETELLYPTHRVAKINRNGLATVDGLKVDLAQNEIALIQLVKR